MPAVEPMNILDASTAINGAVSLLAGPKHKPIIVLDKTQKNIDMIREE